MRSWFFFSLLLISLSGCLKGYDYTLDYRNKFFEKLKSFEHKRSQLRNSFTLVFEGIEMKLQTPKPNFRSLAWEWEGRLGTLEHQIQRLQEDIITMDTLSKNFYRQLRQMNDNMKDKIVKEREKIMNEQHEKEWKILRAVAKRNMHRAKGAAAIGRDAHKVFIGSGIRGKRETALKTMREVRSTLFHAMRRLEHFSHSTEILFTLENDDHLLEEIKKMDERREEVATKLDVIAKKMKNNLEGKDVNLNEISWRWESKYADMSYELESLGDDFENIKKLTQLYYDKSVYHTNKINTPSIQAEENKNQEQHQIRLGELYKRIDSIKVKIANNIRFGEDAYQVLINAARRKHTTEALAQLTAIRKKLSEALEELKEANKDLKAIFDGKKKKKITAKPIKKIT